MTEMGPIEAPGAFRSQVRRLRVGVPANGCRVTDNHRAAPVRRNELQRKDLYIVSSCKEQFLGGKEMEIFG